LLADTIHRQSSRASKPFVAINCSAIPHELLESELFGHMKGAFTGATHNREGLFTTANGGTVLLDEIGDMPYALQAKLLRVLQENVLRPVGGRADIPIDIRILSATHMDLGTAIVEKRFREDLYYRLNVVNRLPCASGARIFPCWLIIFSPKLPAEPAREKSPCPPKPLAFCSATTGRAIFASSTM